MPKQSPDNETTRRLLAKIAQAGPRYRKSRQRIYELSEAAINAGITIEDIYRTSDHALTRKTLARIRDGKSQMDKPPTYRLREWRDRQ